MNAEGYGLSTMVTSGGSAGSLLSGHDLTWIAGYVVVVNAFDYRDSIPLAILNGCVLPAVLTSRLFPFKSVS
jgi:hypothetical protein